MARLHIRSSKHTSTPSLRTSKRTGHDPLPTRDAAIGVSAAYHLKAVLPVRWELLPESRSYRCAIYCFFCSGRWRLGRDPALICHCCCWKWNGYTNLPGTPFHRSGLPRRISVVIRSPSLKGVVRRGCTLVTVHVYRTTRSISSNN